MTSQRSIHDILLDALLEIREEHGFVACTIKAEWMDTVSTPGAAVIRIDVEGRAAA